MNARKPIAALVGVLVAASAVATAGGESGSQSSRSCRCHVQDPSGKRAGSPEPRDFTTRIDNPWWPMRPGSRWVYRETDPEGTKLKVVVTVTRKTKKIANGVTARVVHDVVTEDGELVEVTDDWYAQDRCGNVWYLGETTKEYENGKVVSTEGSFEAGVDGAQAGVVMLAKPRAGIALPAGVLRRPRGGPGRGGQPR